MEENRTGRPACSIDRPSESSSAACSQASKMTAENRTLVFHQLLQEKGLACLYSFWMADAKNGLLFSLCYLKCQRGWDCPKWHMAGQGINALTVHDKGKGEIKVDVSGFVLFKCYANMVFLSQLHF